MLTCRCVWIVAINLDKNNNKGKQAKINFMPKLLQGHGTKVTCMHRFFNNM